MKCSKCGKKVGRDGVCVSCGTQCRTPKTSLLGNFALVFAFFIPIVGLVLGIIAVCLAPGKQDKVLLADGIKAIVMSVVVTAAHILLLYVLAMLGVAVPFIIANIAG